MNYRDEYNNKIPFYMTYPIQNMYLTEMEYEKDMERMKELYPREVKKIQEMVERRCDEMEYDGSRMYDENPDRYMLEEEARRMYERFIRENPQYYAMRTGMSRPENQMNPNEDMSMQQRDSYREDNWLRSLIGIMFHDEIYRRRCRHRRCSRWW